jgi:hypothetical protein
VPSSSASPASSVRTCRRLAPVSRSSARSRRRCATVKANVELTMKIATNAASPIVMPSSATAPS